jgi:hypothetical protein
VYSPYTNVADGLPKQCRWEAVTGASRLKSKEAREPLLLLELLLLLMNANSPNVISRQATPELIDSLTDWIDACYNYRHATGTPEPLPPPDDPTIALLLAEQVSQGGLLGLNATRSIQSIDTPSSPSAPPPNAQARL